MIKHTIRHWLALCCPIYLYYCCYSVVLILRGNYPPSPVAVARACLHLLAFSCAFCVPPSLQLLASGYVAQGRRRVSFVATWTFGTWRGLPLTWILHNRRSSPRVNVPYIHSYSFDIRVPAMRNGLRLLGSLARKRNTNSGFFFLLHLLIRHMAAVILVSSRFHNPLFILSWIVMSKKVIFARRLSLSCSLSLCLLFIMHWIWRGIIRSRLFYLYVSRTCPIPLLLLIISTHN